MISWIKLDINILDDAKIKIIRSHPDGNSIVVLWIGLLCLAMKSSRPGIIEISDGMPYTVDDLSSLFNIEKKTVELGLALFAKYKMVDLFDGNTLEIINFSKHQSIEELERKRELTRARVNKYRNNLKCNALLTHDQRNVTPTDKIRKDKIRKDNNTPPEGVFVLPEWIPEETWKAYLEVRNKKRAAKTSYALNLIIKKLEKLKSEFKPVDILNQSITGGWTDVYPLKNQNIIKKTVIKDDFTWCKKCGARRLRSDVDENGICSGRCNNAAAAL